VKDILAVLASSTEGQFQDLNARVLSLPGIIQRLEDVLTAQYETGEHGEVSDFDFIGMNASIIALTQERNYGIVQP
jgi:hypothetical protein